VVEVTARASWQAWAASSFGAALEDSAPGLGLSLPASDSTDAPASSSGPFQGRDGAELPHPGSSSSAAAAVGRAMGVRLAATGFFDPRGVGLPAEIGALTLF
jgi:hypothetical protein